jgi:NMD protein affecting ribosome stability and mRNA decay
LQTLGWSSVCQVRKDRREQQISDEEQAESFERRLAAIS